MQKIDLQLNTKARLDGLLDSGASGLVSGHVLVVDDLLDGGGHAVGKRLVLEDWSVLASVFGV